ncbi:MAG: HD domain-containing protein [Hydrogenophilaceae bacterium]|nr:HD domain-containing protein [Hydrogenophilaceae bacterium]
MGILDDWATEQGVDREVLNDYFDTISENAHVVEQQIAQLRQSPRDPKPVAELFRLFHNLKGDARLCRFKLGDDLAHQLESILSRLRAGEIRITDLLGETLLLAYDRLEMTVGSLLNNKPTANLKLDQLIQGLTDLAEAEASDIDMVAQDLIESVAGFRPSAQAAVQGVIPIASMEAAADNRTGDLLFFRSLALQLEQRSPLFYGRTSRNLQLAHSINEAADKPIDPLQLEVAVYMHDVGMMFLPESVWLKAGGLSPAEKSLLQRHTDYSAGLLTRMPGWQEAVRIIAQHHEKPDGRGYPAGLKADQICPGAKLMAIVDAFEAVMLKQSHRGPGRSMLRAAAEINASEQQFAAEWIAPFNQVIRNMLGE